jgi:YbbR domain-containing protein
MIKRLFSKLKANWHIKILALLLATILFIIVRNDKDSVGVIYVTIKYKNQPKDHILLNELIYSVKLTVRGPWTGVKKLNNKNWTKKLIIDLSKTKGGRFDLDSTLFSMPKGIKISTITPPYLPVRMEVTLKRVTPVSIKVTSGRFYKVSEVFIRPSNVSLKGPKSLVLAFPSLPLTPQHITKVGYSELKLSLPELPPKLEITPKIKKVTVKVLIEAAMGNKKFVKRPVIVEGKATKFTYSPTEVTVVVHGSKKRLYSLSPTTFTAYVTLNKNIKTPKELPVRIRGLNSKLTYTIIPSKIKIKPVKQPVILVKPVKPVKPVPVPKNENE